MGARVTARRRAAIPLASQLEAVQRRAHGGVSNPPRQATWRSPTFPPPRRRCRGIRVFAHDAPPIQHTRSCSRPSTVASDGAQELGRRRPCCGGGGDGREGYGREEESGGSAPPPPAGGAIPSAGQGDGERGEEGGLRTGVDMRRPRRDERGGLMFERTPAGVQATLMMESFQPPAPGVAMRKRCPSTSGP